jgi:hypothetical protein
MNPQIIPEAEVLSGRLEKIDGRLIDFLRYWNGARGNKLMPARPDIDPVDIPHALLPHLFLVEPVEGGRRLKVRLVGSEMAIAAGRPITGLHFDEFHSNKAYMKYISALYGHVMEQRRPVVAVSRFGLAGQEHRVTQRILCPLSPDGETVSMVISCQVFDTPPDRWTNLSLTSGGPFEGLFEAIIAP